ncbi:MAG: arginine--tRNA ligase, partial [Pseudomonadota bacterium]|nr:arginine--tRNA ligase [Pseudomonadota bacterium]
MKIKNFLTEKFATAMVELGIPADCPPSIALSSRPEFGDYQVNGAMKAAKKIDSKPRDLAALIIEKVELSEAVDKLEIAGPGFINIFLSAKFLAEEISKPLISKLPKKSIKNIVIDHSSPNLAKEMHVGHLRSTIIGDCLARVFEKLGHKVIRQNHMGDWGTQFGMLIAELEQQIEEGNEAEFALNDLEHFYQKAKKHFDEDENFANTAREYVVKLQSGDPYCKSLWEKFINISISHNQNIYEKLNVGLKTEHIKPESSYNDKLAPLVADLMQRNIAVDSDGAKVIFLPELADKNGKPSPMIIEKSGGGYLYSTTDLAAVNHRSENLKADRILYLIDARQSLHMKQVFIAARKAGLAPKGVSLEHHAFGMMMDESGRPFKTRTGGTVKLNDLLNEATDRARVVVTEKNKELSEDEITSISTKVGIGAIKYADLSITRTHDYVFNWKTMLSFDGNTAPYLQYAYTRIQSIFRKSDIELEQNVPI